MGGGTTTVKPMVVVSQTGGDAHTQRAWQVFPLGQVWFCYTFRTQSKCTMFCFGFFSNRALNRLQVVHRGPERSHRTDPQKNPKSILQLFFNFSIYSGQSDLHAVNQYSLGSAASPTARFWLCPPASQPKSICSRKMRL